MLTAFVFTRQGAPFLADVNMKAGSTIFYLIGIFFIHLTLIASPRPMFESETELFTKHANRLPQAAFSPANDGRFLTEKLLKIHTDAPIFNRLHAHIQIINAAKHFIAHDR